MLGDGEVGELDVLWIRPHGDDGKLEMLTGFPQVLKNDAIEQGKDGSW